MTIPNLFDCAPLNARITETGCLNNQDRWATERHAPLRPCGEYAAGKEIAARNEVVSLFERAKKHAQAALAAGDAEIGPCLDDDTPERRRILYPDSTPASSPPPPVSASPCPFLPSWTPYGHGTCKRNGCGGREYGQSGLCFSHLRRSIGEPYHYAPGVQP